LGEPPEVRRDGVRRDGPKIVDVEGEAVIGMSGSDASGT